MHGITQNRRLRVFGPSVSYVSVCTYVVLDIFWGVPHLTLLFPLLTFCVISKGTSEAIIGQPQRLLLRLEKPCENRELGIMREARAPFPLLCCRAPHCALMGGIGA